MHFGGDVLHFFQARRDQARQADDIHPFNLGARQNLVAGHHHTEVDNLKIVALQHHTDDVFANVVHIALDGGDDDLAFGLDIFTGLGLQALFFFNVRNQMCHSLLHHASGFDHLRQKHLALAKQIAHHVHAVHQRTFDDVQRSAFFGQDDLVGLFGVFGDEVGDTVHQRVAQAGVDADRRIQRTAPGQLLAVVFGRAFGGFGDFDQAFAGIQPRFAFFVIRRAVQHHVFDAFFQNRLQIVIHADHAGVDDAHVHTRRNGVVQKHGVDGLAHRVVATEAERHVGHAARHFRTRQVLLDPAGRVDEIDRVIVVLFNAGGNGEDIRVENDVFGREIHRIDQQPVGPFANLDLAFVGIGLAFFVKRHHHRCRAVTAQELGLVQKLRLALFHADGVDNAFALYTAQPGLDHAPFRAVYHHRHTGDIGFGRHQVQKLHHRRLAVEHGFVHVHVDDLRAVFDLLACHRERLLKLAIQNHPRKGLRARDVGALADVDEQRFLVDEHRLQSRQAHGLHVAVVNRFVRSDSLYGSCRRRSHGSPSKESLRAGERRWLPRMLRQQPKPDAMQNIWMSIQALQRSLSWSYFTGRKVNRLL